MVNLHILINIERVSKHSVTILGQRVHTVNNFHCCVIIKRMYVFVSEDHMLDWQ